MGAMISKYRWCPATLNSNGYAPSVIAPIILAISERLQFRNLQTELARPIAAYIKNNAWRYFIRKCPNHVLINNKQDSLVVTKVSRQSRLRFLLCYLSAPKESA